MEGTKTWKVVMAAVVMAVILFSSVSATNIRVGGATGWDLSTNFTYWSSSTLIFVNDSLEFIYTRAHDVIEVTEAKFATCDITSPIAAYYDINGKTLINLPKPGPRYFVCGRSNYFTEGLKLYVQVLDKLQPNTSSPSYPAKPSGDHTSPGDGEKTDVLLWKWVALFINLAVLFRLANSNRVGFLMRLYLSIIIFSLLVLLAAILMTNFLVQGHSEVKTCHSSNCLFGNLSSNSSYMTTYIYY